MHGVHQSADLNEDEVREQLKDSLGLGYVSILKVAANGLQYLN